jgi:threonine aldolase
LTDFTDDQQQQRKRRKISVSIMDFTSDNYAGAHPAINEALRLNAGGRAKAYGLSTIDLRIEEVFNQIFEKEVAVFFVATGNK